MEPTLELENRMREDYHAWLKQVMESGAFKSYGEDERALYIACKMAYYAGYKKGANIPEYEES